MKKIFAIGTVVLAMVGGSDLRAAGVQPGSVCAEPIIGSDVFPTLLELAGVPLPENVVFDGTSIVPLLRGEELNRPRPLYWRNNSHKFQLALMEGDWKIVGTPMRTEFNLYNLRTDPHETTDLSTQEPERFEKMRAALIEYDREVLHEGPDWWKKDRRTAVPAE